MYHSEVHGSRISNRKILWAQFLYFETISPSRGDIPLGMTKTDEQIKKPTAQKILNVQQILKNHTDF